MDLRYVQYQHQFIASIMSNVPWTDNNYHILKHNAIIKIGKFGKEIKKQK